MVIELVALVESITAIGALANEAVKVAKNISSGFRAKNEEAKKQLVQDLEQLQDSIKLVGKLAIRIEGYIQTYENVLKLKLLCNRAEDFLKDNNDDCNNEISANYAGNWRVLETIFQAIESNRDAPMKVIMDRAEWYDDKDKGQIERFLNEFTEAYKRGNRHVSNKMTSELAFELRSMTDALQQAETALRNTIYDRILRKLQTLES